MMFSADTSLYGVAAMIPSAVASEMRGAGTFHSWIAWLKSMKAAKAASGFLVAPLMLMPPM